MPCIVPTSGVLLDLAFPQPEAIRLHDIARALSRQVMVCGHTARPYHVAEHSLLIGEILRHDLKVTDPAVLLAGVLMHAAWAYLQTPEHAPYEAVVATAIRRHFQVTTAWVSSFSTLQKAQAIAEATAARDLQWARTEAHEAEPSTARLDTVTRHGTSGPEWECLYVHQVESLIAIRQQLASSVPQHASAGAA